MNQAEQDRISELIFQINTEKVHPKFMLLVEELNRILAAKEKRLEGNPPPPDQTPKTD